MAGLSIAFLYIAWPLSWLGTFVATCTGSDPKSLTAGILYSVFFYLTAVVILWFSRLSTLGLIFSLPLFPLLIWQAMWGMQLFFVVNIDGQSACNLMFDEEAGPIRGGWIQQIHAPYYVLVSAGAPCAIVCSYWRYRRERERPVLVGSLQKSGSGIETRQ